VLTFSFDEDLALIRRFLKEGTSFGFSRFGDGELMIMEGQKLNLLYKKEFNFQGEKWLAQGLIDSIQLNRENYFIGIPCPCCQPIDKINVLKKLSGLAENRMTWANLFVNANFKKFKESVVPLFSNYEFIGFIGPGNHLKLPFRVTKSYHIGPDAWKNDTHILDKIRNDITNKNLSKGLFLFAAGPFANILCAKLFEEFENNTFIDVGSVFNIELGIGANRGYLSGASTLKKKCVWYPEDVDESMLNIEEKNHAIINPFFKLVISKIKKLIS